MAPTDRNDKRQTEKHKHKDMSIDYKDYDNEDKSILNHLAESIYV